MSSVYGIYFQKKLKKRVFRSFWCCFLSFFAFYIHKSTIFANIYNINVYVFPCHKGQHVYTIKTYIS